MRGLPSQTPSLLPALFECDEYEHFIKAGMASAPSVVWKSFEVYGIRNSFLWNFLT